ncbi:MAG: fatty acid desaturase [Prochloraceae cyanobacterium]
MWDFGQRQSMKAPLHPINHKLSLIIALLIIAFWLVNTFICLHTDLNKLSWLLLCILILGQTFLSTGLFITAHDAMHGLVYPLNPRLNDFIGAIALNLYCLFSYQNFKKLHSLHHNFPATNLDPDYHDGVHSSFGNWYIKFMKTYINWSVMLKLTLVINGLVYIFHISRLNISLFWGLSLFLSSFQLFIFGTFLPHRQQEKGKGIQSLSVSPLFSFIACYHFSYHWEHHQYPYLPWWKIPSVKSHT